MVCRSVAFRLKSWMKLLSSSHRNLFISYLPSDLLSEVTDAALLDSRSECFLWMAVLQNPLRDSDEFFDCFCCLPALE